MDSGWFAGMIGFAFVMAATPGPNNIMATASGATYGIARTLPLIGGIAIGVATIMLCVAAFGSSVAADPDVGATLKWIGVAYLLWLAWKLGSAKPDRAGSTKSEPREAAPPTFVQGALFQFVNPKLWVMVGGAVLAYGPAGGVTGRPHLPLLFAFVFGTMTFLSTVAWAALGASIGRVLASHRAIRGFNVAMAMLMVASLVPIVLQ